MDMSLIDVEISPDRTTELNVPLVNIMYAGRKLPAIDMCSKEERGTACFQVDDGSAGQRFGDDKKKKKYSINVEFGEAVVKFVEELESAVMKALAKKSPSELKSLFGKPATDKDIEKYLRKRVNRGLDGSGPPRIRINIASPGDIETSSDGKRRKKFSTTVHTLRLPDKTEVKGQDVQALIGIRPPYEVLPTVLCSVYVNRQGMNSTVGIRLTAVTLYAIYRNSRDSTEPDYHMFLRDSEIPDKEQNENKKRNLTEG